MTTSVTLEGLRRRCYECEHGESGICAALDALVALKADPTDQRATAQARSAMDGCLLELGQKTGDPRTADGFG